MNAGAQRIREYLAKRGMTQQAFAVALGTSAPHVSRIIHGHSLPSIPLAMRIYAQTDGYVVPADFVRPARAAKKR